MIGRLKLCKGYLPGTRGYVIYSPRGVPEGNIPHIPEGQVNNMLIFLLVRIPNRNKDLK